MLKSELKMTYPGELLLKASYTIDHHAELEDLEKFVAMQRESTEVTLNYDGMGTMTLDIHLNAVPPAPAPESEPTPRDSQNKPVPAPPTDLDDSDLEDLDYDDLPVMD